MADYIVSYDISDQKRLRKLAKELEEIGVRIQYSVFFIPGMSREAIDTLVDIIKEIVDESEDDVRIYRVLGKGMVLGRGIDLSKYSLIT